MLHAEACHAHLVIDVAIAICFTCFSGANVRTLPPGNVGCNLYILRINAFDCSSTAYGSIGAVHSGSNATASSLCGKRSVWQLRKFADCMLRCAALQLDAAKLDALCGAYSHDRKRPGVLTAAELESLPFWLPECRRTVPSVRFAAARCMLHIARCELRVLIKATLVVLRCFGSRFGGWFTTTSSSTAAHPPSVPRTRSFLPDYRTLATGAALAAAPRCGPHGTGPRIPAG